MTERAAPVCNIGPKEARTRLASGAGSFAAGVGFYLILRSGPVAWRLILVAPFFIAGLGLFQAKARVCVAHARQGTCNLDAGLLGLTDPGQVAELRRAARGIYLRAAVFAVALTAIAFWF